MTKRTATTKTWLAATTAGFIAVGCSLANAPITPKAGGAVDGAGAMGTGALSLNNRRFVQNGETVIQVPFGNKAELQRLVDSGFDVWTTQGQTVIGAASTQLLKEIKEAGTKYTMLSPNEGYSVRNNFDSGYKTYATLVPALRGLASKYSAICKLEDIGDTWEKTKGKADRDLWMLHITSGKHDQKPGIVFFGNHHARELVTVEVPLRLATHLLENYGKDPAITELVDTRDIYIVPMVNPDGHIHAEKGESWRKNTHDDKSEVTLDNRGYSGTDLNRNYGYQWNTGGSSGNPGDETYHGKTAFSEPETQATSAFLTGHPNITMMMSYHSFSNLVLWPWGWSNSPSPADQALTTVGTKLASFNKYKPEQASDLYVASGITDDFSYGKLGMLSFTTEIGGWNDNFDPPFSRVEQFWNENKDGALYLIKLAGEPKTAMGPEARIDNGRIVFDGRGVTAKAASAEYYVGKVGAPGTGTPIDVDVKGAGGLTVSSLNAPAKGRLFVRGRDAAGQWGPALAVRL